MVLQSTTIETRHGVARLSDSCKSGLKPQYINDILIILQERPKTKTGMKVKLREKRVVAVNFSGSFTFMGAFVGLT